MATASKKKPSRKQKAAARPAKAVRARKRPAPSHLDDITEPDRSAPPLAEVDAAALEFIEAIDRFKKQHARPFPSWSEVLMVLRQLGYSRR